MEAGKELLSLLNAEAERVVDVAAQLVRIPSENPPGDTRRIATFAYDYLRAAGLECELVNPEKQIYNVVGRVEGSLPGPSVVYNGHLDTFPVNDATRWSYDPFGGTIENGRLYGRGSCDMKGGLAASMVAATLLARIKNRLPGRVSITLVSDEETGSRWGTRYLLETRPELYGDALINGEPSSPYNIRLGEMGMFWYRFAAKTPGGHGAYQKLKRSATLILLDLIRDLLKFNEEKCPVPEAVVKVALEARESFDRLIGERATEVVLGPSANLGVIRGGAVVNMVPESCQAEIDFRLPPGTDDRFLRDFLARTMKRHPDCTMEEFQYTPPTFTDPSGLLARCAVETANEVRPHPVVPAVNIGGTDCRFWRLKGVPAVVYGPHQHNMGSADEYIEIAELPDVVKVQTLTAWRFLTRWEETRRSG